MGSCYECRCTIDGAEQERACLHTVASVSRVATRGASARSADAPPRAHRRIACDVLVVGAGPAGLAAAEHAARRGKRVVLVDENPGLGGQIWRADRGPESARARAAVSAKVDVRTETSVVLPLGERRLRLASRDEVLDVRFDALVLATGATELLLPFPGWTLPNVLGLGGLQALAKGGLELAGKRVVLAGSGPLLLAVADVVARKGASVLAVAEQAPRANLARFGVALAARPAKLAQAFGFAGALAKLRTSAWPVEAVGGERLSAIVLRGARGLETLECDYAGVGFGLVPNGRLAAALGCALDGRRVRVDAEQRTSVAWIFAAGECTGIGGKDKARLEGEIAGASAAGDLEPARRLAGARERELAFADRIERAFAPRAELRTLARPETIACRCEDVTCGEVARATELARGVDADVRDAGARGGAADAAAFAWRTSKLQTRAGMGACQGRVCGPALEFLDGRTARDVRAPLAPVTLDALAAPMETPQ
ncbi:MAG: NAD(P)/FAD-dependent oxidoreductase [Planctomycetes bacterium]|nr:NAD(P)/FAD-dependent oxidoreductase [Planctomycetota bacterium]